MEVGLQELLVSFCLRLSSGRRKVFLAPDVARSWGRWCLSLRLERDEPCCASSKQGRGRVELGDMLSLQSWVAEEEEVWALWEFEESSVEGGCILTNGIEPHPKEGSRMDDGLNSGKCNALWEV